MIYNFDFKNYLTVWDLEEEFRILKIKNYCYGFYTDQEVIKYGKGNDFEWESNYWGNRAVRQADAFPGWLVERYTRCNSKKKFKKQMQEKGLSYTKSDVSLIVYDYTEECSLLPNDEVDNRLLLVEGRLVNDYVEKYGRKPVCNVAKTKGEYAINNFNKHFVSL